MLITQKQAIRILREQAGFSIERAKTTVRELPKTADGMRQKVRRSDLTRIINDISKPSTVYVTERISRPLSKKMRERIRLSAGQ